MYFRMHDFITQHPGGRKSRSRRMQNEGLSVVWFLLNSTMCTSQYYISKRDVWLGVGSSDNSGFGLRLKYKGLDWLGKAMSERDGKCESNKSRMGATHPSFFCTHKNNSNDKNDEDRRLFLSMYLWDHHAGNYITCRNDIRAG